jgi:hypothetical protein
VPIVKQQSVQNFDAVFAVNADAEDGLLGLLKITAGTKNNSSIGAGGRQPARCRMFLQPDACPRDASPGRLIFRAAARAASARAAKEWYDCRSRCAPALRRI